MLEEWRSGRDSVGRTHEAHWKILLEGTKVSSILQIIWPISAHNQASLMCLFESEGCLPERLLSGLVLGA